MPVPGYTLGNVLGEGAFAQTRIGYHTERPDQPVAVKSILRSHPRFDLESIQKEIAVMQRIKHPRCVNLLEVHEDDNAIHMVEELGAGGELFDRIIELGVFTGARGLHAGCVRALACGTLYGGTATRCALAPLTAVLCLPPCLPAEVDAVHLIHQVVDGVQYLHSMGCIHRDLKPENLLMVGRTPGTDEYMQLKICDFGLSAMRDVDGTKEAFDKDLQKMMGTEEYLAPEVFVTSASVAKIQAGEHYTGKIDVWAIGVIYYIMLTGRFPFMRKDDDSFFIVQQICKGNYDTECMAHVSPDSQNLITSCLTLNPDERPTAFELMDLPVFKNDTLPTEDLHCLVKLSSLNSYKTWRRRRKTLDAVLSIARLKVTANIASRTKKEIAPQDAEAANLYHTIHQATPGKDDKGLEFYEIVLYLQERMAHLFYRRDRKSGNLVVCPDRVKTFSQLLKEKIDTDGDGSISKEEFIRGYSIWQMHIKKAQMLQNSERQASFIYRK
eukprot:Tamp_12869.p1 GENE.Tamp_12869~~Tamp_12869.p1  ORF type:complete len:521 (-),score=105.61 Tamp_12869:209-1699(-)